MKTTEIGNLFERIKKHYNTFGYDEEKIKEWHKFLKDFTNDSVLDNFDKFVLEYHDRPPFVYELTRGAIKNEETNEMRLQCEFCKEYIEYSNYETHWRRCDKIDFINRRAKELKGEGIDYNLYRTMSDTELNERYRKIMEHLVKTQDTSKPLFQTL